MKNTLPLVSEHIGFKLKKLGFNWFCTTKYTEYEGLSNSITTSGANWNSDVWDDTSLGNICSIPTHALALRWLKLEHGIFLGKDWMELEFNLVDLKTTEPIAPFITMDLTDFENPDELTEYMIDRALDYLIKMYAPCFGDVVRLTNKTVGRCIGNNKAVYFPDAPSTDRAEVGDVDLEFLRVQGKNNFPARYVVPTLEDIKQFKTPEPTN